MDNPGERDDQSVHSMSFETGELVQAHWSNRALVEVLQTANERLAAMEGALELARNQLRDQAAHIEALAQQTLRPQPQHSQGPAGEPSGLQGLANPPAIPNPSGQGTGSGTSSSGSHAKADPPKPFKGAGTDDGVEIDQWILSMDLYFRVETRITPAQRAIRAVLNLSGDALLWYQSKNLDLDTLSWDALKNELRTAFRAPDYVVRARDQLHRCTQSGNVLNYTKAFRRCLLRLGQDEVSPSEALYRYIQGLKHEVRAWVRMQSPLDISHAAVLADRYESSFRTEEKQEKGKQPQREGRQKPREGQEKKPGDGKRKGKTPENGKQERGGGSQPRSRECFLCGSKEHFVSKCPKRAQLQAMLASESSEN